MFIGNRVLCIFQSLNLNGGLRGGSPSADDFWDFHQNNPFFSTFQLKFCLKSSKLIYYCTSRLYLTVSNLRRGGAECDRG